jgi:two-component system capsular synthesis response regulator RcsB
MRAARLQMDLDIMLTRLIIADDHPVIRAGLRAILERQGQYRIAAEVDSPESLAFALERTPADLLITDFAMPSTVSPDGHAMLSMIRRRYPALPIALFTMFNNIPSLRMAMQIGVRAIIDKAAPMERIPEALREVSAGTTYISQTLRRSMHEEVPGLPTAGAALSPKEMEVIRLYISGYSVTQIAAKLGRTISTISRQRTMGMEKLGLRTDAELFAYAYEHGLAPAPRVPMATAVAHLQLPAHLHLENVTVCSACELNLDV